MKNEKYTKDYKAVARSVGYYEVMLLSHNGYSITAGVYGLDKAFTNDIDCIDEEKLGFDYYFFFLRERANYNKFHFFSEKVFKRMSERLRLQFEDSNPDFLPKWIHDGENIVVRRTTK